MDQSFLDLLRDSRSFLLIGHEHPDGDCLGSQVALYHLLRQMGKEPTICNPDPPFPARVSSGAGFPSSDAERTATARNGNGNVIW